MSPRTARPGGASQSSAMNGQVNYRQVGAIFRAERHTGVSRQQRPRRGAADEPRLCRRARPRPGAPLRSAPSGAFGDLDPASARRLSGNYRRRLTLNKLSRRTRRAKPSIGLFVAGDSSGQKPDAPSASSSLTRRDGHSSSTLTGLRVPSPARSPRFGQKSADRLFAVSHHVF
jgi:hypothetical protein